MYNSTEYYINKGKELAKNGKHKEAANSFSEAIKIDEEYIEAYNLLSESFKILAESEPHIYLPDLAMTLNNLGILQYDGKEYTHADKSYIEALKIYKKLVKKKPHVYLPDMASTLNNLGALQSAEKEYTLALKSYSEALKIYKKLAKKNPHIYLPDVAMTLNNLGVLQYDEKEYTHADKSFTEALEIRRKLAEKKPDIYLPDVAMTLNNLGNLQSDKKKYTLALKSYTEALETYKKLAKSKHHIYIPNVAMTLNNLGALQYYEREYTLSQKSYTEALGIYKKLAKSKHHIYIPNVAMTLSNLGLLQNDIKNYKNTLKSYKEALGIYKKLTKKEPHIYTPNLAKILNDLGNLQKDKRDDKNALKSYTEALEIYKKLADNKPHIYIPDVAMTLSNLGLLQNDIKNYKNALKSYKEALGIYKKLTKKEPHIYLPNMAMTLSNLGLLQNNNKKNTLALKSYAESLEILEQLLNTTNSYPTLKGDIMLSYEYLLADAVKNNKNEAAFYLFWSLHEKSMTREKAKNNLPKLHKRLKTRGTQNNKNFTILCAQDCGDLGFVMGIIDENNIDFELVKDDEIEEIFSHLSSFENKNHEINAIIQSFYNKLPHFVKELFSVTEKKKKEIIICGDTPFSAFPWELLPCTDNRNEFLGLHYSLPRLSNLSFEELDAFVEFHYGNNKDYAIIAPHDTDLNNILGIVPDEAKEIQKKLGQQNFIEQGFYLGGDANRENFETILEKEPSLVYYSGHGGILQNETCLILHNNSSYKDTFSFSRYHLGLLRERTKRNKLFSQNPLFILNSCYSGMTRSYGATKEDFISSLIDEGAGGVIASPMPIYQGVGFDFGTIFLNYLTDMNNVGESLLLTRKELAEKYNDTNHHFWGSWAMIHLYGSPYAKFIKN